LRDSLVSAITFPQNQKLAQKEYVKNVHPENAKIKEKLGIQP
jgi:hypothetical protein